MGKISRSTALLLAVTLSLWGCADAEEEQGEGGGGSGPEATTKVGFLFVGPITDYGWTKAHEDGRLYLENFGENVETLVRANVTTETSAAMIDELVAEGATIVFTTSFDFLEAARAAPGKHPGVTTLNCSGFQTGPGFGSYQARAEEMEYLTGMVAGRMTQTNKIGVVAALRIYEQMAHINAFALGVRAVNPDAVVEVRWVGWWFDPAREEIGTNELIDGGADVIRGLTDTNIPMAIADTRGVFSMGHDSKDGCAVAPETCLVNSFYNWGPLYVNLVNEIREGQYPADGRIDYVSLAELDVVGISPFAAAVPEAVRTEVLAKKEDIIARRFNVFQGPFNHDDGTVWAAAGTTLSDAELLCTDRYVEGVVDVHGPDCAAAADCGDNLECTGGKCVAPDFSGCGG